MDSTQPDPAGAGLTEDYRLRVLHATGFWSRLPPCPPWPDLN